QECGLKDILGVGSAAQRPPRGRQHERPMPFHDGTKARLVTLVAETSQQLGVAPWRRAAALPIVQPAQERSPVHGLLPPEDSARRAGNPSRKTGGSTQSPPGGRRIPRGGRRASGRRRSGLAGKRSGGRGWRR